MSFFFLGLLTDVGVEVEGFDAGLVDMGRVGEFEHNGIESEADVGIAVKYHFMVRVEHIGDAGIEPGCGGEVSPLIELTEVEAVGMLDIVPKGSEHQLCGMQHDVGHRHGRAHVGMGQLVVVEPVGAEQTQGLEVGTDSVVGGIVVVEHKLPPLVLWVVGGGTVEMGLVGVDESQCALGVVLRVAGVESCLFHRLFGIGDGERGRIVCGTYREIEE